MSFAGFPNNVRYTPVPDPLLGPLLEQIKDLGELKCTLRVIWIIHHKKRSPQFVTKTELLSDTTLVRSLTRGSGDINMEIGRVLSLAVKRGTLAKATVKQNDREEELYVTNIESQRKALTALKIKELEYQSSPYPDTLKKTLKKPNIFSLYENNIGMLNPFIAEELKEAEENYPQKWIEEAFTEALSKNVSNWRYIVRILDRWEREGKNQWKT